MGEFDIGGFGCVGSRFGEFFLMWWFSGCGAGWFAGSGFGDVV